MADIRKIFYPESIAVVGVSENLYKWGSFIFINILGGGFRGRVFPVAKNKETVYGHRAYNTVAEIAESVDLVFITTPASSVMGVLADCVKKGVKNVVMITSGFSETGEEGKRLEEQVIAYSRENGINIVGPNTMGIVNTAVSLYATGSQVRAPRGGISIIAQSGNVGNQIMEWAEQQNIGLGKFVGSGNEGVLDCEDYIEYFGADPDTSVILMYIEGVDDGRRFMDTARRTSMKKPVIALKAGRTETGSRAAASHTGAMAGSFKTYESALRQSGVMLVKAPTELLTISAAFDSMPLPKGNRVGVVTLGGGWGVITADECEERGLTLPPLPGDVYEKLDRMLPPFWSKGNPVDLVGQPSIELFKESMNSMVASDAYDAVILLGMVGAGKYALRIHASAASMGYYPHDKLEGLTKLIAERQANFLDNIVELMEKYDKPIYPVALVSAPEDEMIHYKDGSRFKAIIYKTPEEAVFCLEKQFEYYRYRSRRATGQP
ncbi:MAG TPA: CoA-binding protein [Spirochaetota bacterium]|nr:CoA-binding protein [Spirochaetota bacterium]